MENINLGEVKTVVNTKRKFGSKAVYYATYIKFQGVETSVLFTLEELETAIGRSRTNPEDLPNLKQSWFKRLFK